jgi:peptide/nickel transport system ATP-binding protein
MTTTNALLSIDHLSISYQDGDILRPTVDRISFTIGRGEVVALVGESGSGKTTIAQSIIGLNAPNAVRTEGSIRFDGEDVSRWSERQLRSLRGMRISLVPQDPGASLDPVQTIGAQLAEVFRLHGIGDRQEVRARSHALIERVGLTEPALRLAQYPHELSGGMKQRVLIAMALALQPRLVIADEPTSALDVTVQRRILDLIDGLRREAGTAVLLVTHDLALAAERADRIIVLNRGRIEEDRPARDLIAAPRSAYTARLLKDAPAFAASVPMRRPRPTQAGEIAISVEGLVKTFRSPGRGEIRAVDDVSFTVAKGTTHALVGGSGSGKTTTIRSVLRFEQPTSGRITVADVDLAGLNARDVRQLRRRIQLVYQNPFSSLDPRQTVAEIVAEPLLNFERLDRAERRARVADILSRVQIPEALYHRRPVALSGGQRQRVAIARALVLKPEIVVLDEAVSALDVTIQAEILTLLDELQRDLGLTYLFISHDLAVVRRIADTVSVMAHGRIVETGEAATVFEHPTHPYTRELIAAIPRPQVLMSRDVSEGNHP